MAPGGNVGRAALTAESSGCACFCCAGNACARFSQAANCSAMTSSTIVKTMLIPFMLPKIAYPLFYKIGLGLIVMSVFGLRWPALRRDRDISACLLSH